MTMILLSKERIRLLPLTSGNICFKMEVKNRGEALVLLLREDESNYELDLLDLRNDVVFKAFFGDRRNNQLLLDFLKAILR